MHNFSFFKCWQINVFNAALKNKTCLQPVFPAGHRLATLVWNVEFHTKRPGLHPTVADLRNLTLVSKFA